MNAIRRLIGTLFCLIGWCFAAGAGLVYFYERSDDKIGPITIFGTIALFLIGFGSHLRTPVRAAAAPADRGDKAWKGLEAMASLAEAASAEARRKNAAARREELALQAETEARADKKLQLAMTALAKDKNSGVRRLYEICDDFPGTPAAEQAEAILKST